MPNDRGTYAYLRPSGGVQYPALVVFSRVDDTAIELVGTKQLTMNGWNQVVVGVKLKDFSNDALFIAVNGQPAEVGALHVPGSRRSNAEDLYIGRAQGTGGTTSVYMEANAVGYYD